MKPLRVAINWMHKALVDEYNNSVGRGWIKWIDNGDLLIKYSLLS